MLPKPPTSPFMPRINDEPAVAPPLRSGINAFEDEVLRRGIMSAPTTPTPQPPAVSPAVSPVSPIAAARVGGGGNLDPHTLGSYKQLSDTFGTTTDRFGNPIATAAMPSIDTGREGHLTARIAGQNAQLSEDLGTTTDRFGNIIAAPVLPRFFKEGGEAISGGTSLEEYIQQSLGGQEEEPIGSAQQLLADMTRLSAQTSPTRQSIRRGARPANQGSTAPKATGMKLPDLAQSKEMDYAIPASGEVKDKGSAREQMEELVRVYQLKINAAKNKARGLAADTFGAPTLEQASLTKNSLAKRRFADGGEVKKGAEAEEDRPSASRTLRRLALATARGIPQAVTGLVDLAALPLTLTGRMKAEDVVGTTDYLTKRGLLPKPQEGLASESAELLSSMVSPGGAAKAAVVGMIGPRGIIEAARRSQLFKGKGLTVPEESFSAQEMLKMLQEQGIDTSRTWLRGKKSDNPRFVPQNSQDTLQLLYDYQKRPDAIEQAVRDSRRSQAFEGRTLSRQPGDRGVTKFNTKGGVWLTESPSIAQTYTGDKGYVIPVYASKPDVVIDAKGEQWDDFYRKDKDWKEAFADPEIRLVEVKNVIDAGPHWPDMLSPEASEEELRAALTATNLFAKKPIESRVVNRITGEPYEYKRGGLVSKKNKPRR